MILVMLDYIFIIVFAIFALNFIRIFVCNLKDEKFFSFKKSVCLYGFVTSIFVVSTIVSSMHTKHRAEKERAEMYKLLQTTYQNYEKETKEIPVIQIPTIKTSDTETEN